MSEAYRCQHASWVKQYSMGQISRSSSKMATAKTPLGNLILRCAVFHHVVDMLIEAISKLLLSPRGQRLRLLSLLWSYFALHESWHTYAWRFDNVGENLRIASIAPIAAPDESPGFSIDNNEFSHVIQLCYHTVLYQSHFLRDQVHVFELNRELHEVLE